jgi:hypothetical protein
MLCHEESFAGRARVDSSYKARTWSVKADWTVINPFGVQFCIDNQTLTSLT